MTTGWCRRTAFKFAATLQAAQAGPKPILIRIETRAGHGAGKPTTKIIEESADKWAFMVHELGMKPQNLHNDGEIRNGETHEPGPR